MAFPPSEWTATTGGIAKVVRGEVLAPDGPCPCAAVRHPLVLDGESRLSVPESSPSRGRA